MDDTTPRHKALVVLFHEIQQLELAHNELDARIAAALDLHRAVPRHPKAPTMHPERFLCAYCAPVLYPCATVRALTEETP